jgi:two-component system nitrogen regulation sensor histidine kinase NtrY
MTESLAPSSIPAAEASRPRGGEGRMRTLFWAAFALAAALTIAAVLLVIDGRNALGAGSGTLLWILGAALALMLGLAALLARRIWRIAHALDAPENGAKLHLRFVSLFSLAAAAPAIVVALFLGAMLSRGVEQWFSERVKTAVEGAAAVGREYVQAMNSNIRAEVMAMAEDLNVARSGLTTDAPTYGRYLAEQASRRFFASAYVIDQTGEVLARAEAEGAPAFQRPAGENFAEAGDDVLVLLFEGQSVVWAMTRLAAYEDAYLLVARDIDAGMLGELRQYETAVSAYREAESRRARMQTLLVLSYLATAGLVLLFAVWLGLANASRISEPIGRLAQAAGRVASGDLAARVDVGGERDEVDALSRAFNRMTAQLETQRADLVNARIGAEASSRFIRAVLSGVSAGVIGLDAEGRVTAANRAAEVLLGLPEGALEGSVLVDIAPEFAPMLASSVGGRRVQIDLVRGDVSTNLSVRRNDDAGGAGFVLTFDDVTKLIAAQRQEAWRDVARRIAHEIKNPLTPIQLSAQRLQRKYGEEIRSDPEVFERCIATILRQVADIGRMVDEFSSFARMPAPRLERSDAGEIVRQVVFAQRLAFPDTVFTIENDERAWPVLCDERLIGQALTNLLKNAGEAIQARRARDGEPKAGMVRVALTEAGARLAITIADNGVGFPVQDRARLVEPYVTTRVKGTGLGLAIVQRVVVDHGGALELGDAPNPPGALVRIFLPQGEPDPAQSAADLVNRENV